ALGAAGIMSSNRQDPASPRTERERPVSGRHLGECLLNLSSLYDQNGLPLNGSTVGGARMGSVPPAPSRRCNLGQLAHQGADAVEALGRRRPVGLEDQLVVGLELGVALEPGDEGDQP